MNRSWNMKTQGPCSRCWGKNSWKTQHYTFCGLFRELEHFRLAGIWKEKGRGTWNQEVSVFHQTDVSQRVGWAKATRPKGGPITGKQRISLMLIYSPVSNVVSGHRFQHRQLLNYMTTVTYNLIPRLEVSYNVESRLKTSWDLWTHSTFLKTLLKLEPSRNHTLYIWVLDTQSLSTIIIYKPCVCLNHLKKQKTVIGYMS